MKVLLAGATGYLGKYIVKELINREMDFKVIVRNPEKLDGFGLAPNQIIKGEVTRPDDLKGVCAGFDVVISSVGITRQKDGLTYMDVDYGANKNLLNEAVKCGVKKFIYVSVLKGEKLRHLAICDAKEKFVDDLVASGLDYSIIRPSGFFSDLKEFYTMALKGKVYLFGDGNIRVNPIHGEDLAVVCLNAIGNGVKNIEVGGPELLTHNEIAETAFKAVGKKVKITYIPHWVRKFLLKVGKLFMSNASYGPFEFFLNVMAMSMDAPKYGKHTLSEFYESLNKK